MRAKSDPGKIHIQPGSVAITSGVWPDPVTSVEPTYWGVGSDIFALLGTYHQQGEQKHPFESWLKQLLQHPNEVLSFDDPRHWSERSFVALCMQTTDTSIELYWHDGLLRSRQGPGTPPSVRQQDTVSDLEETVRISTLRYKGGTTTYLEVLDGQRSLYSAELTLASAHADEYRSLVQLYKALGGGWQH